MAVLRNRGMEAMMARVHEIRRHGDGALVGMDDCFLWVRGRKEDARWFDRAVLRLMGENVDMAHVRLAFQDVLSTLEKSDESADELFGEPQVWADVRIEQWREGGEDAFETQAFTMRDAVVNALALSVLFSTLMALGGLSGAVYSPMIAFVPLLMAIAVIGVVLVWQHVLRKFSRAVAFLLALLWVIVGVMVIVGYILLTDRLNLPRLSSWTVMVPAVVVYALLTWLVSKRWKAASARWPDADGLSANDAVWLTDLAGGLRLRGDMSERRIRRIVADAQQWARESGSGLEDEFGSAKAYAAGFGPSSLRELHAVWFWLALVLVIEVPYMAVAWLGYAGHGAYSKAVATILFVSGLMCLLASVISWWRKRQHR